MSMLYRNGENLKQGLVDYLSNADDVSIFVPYIKQRKLEELLEIPGLRCSQIFVRWKPMDLVTGASDIDIYDLCKEKGIALFINNRIHLKLFTNQYRDAFLGSSNISDRAISNDGDNFNYEICTYVDGLTRDDRLYLYSIENDSILVTDSIYTAIREQISIHEHEVQDERTFSIPPLDVYKSSEFLVSRLPMTDTPDLLWDIYSGNKIAISNEQENCFCHDLALFKIDQDIEKKELFIKKLTTNFFQSPFVNKFLEAVDSAPVTVKKGQTREGLHFGAVRKWFSKTTTTAPTPKAFELTKNVQILYAWIERLSEGKYIVSVPGKHSQVIKLNQEYRKP